MTKPTENKLFDLYDKVAYMPNDGQDDPLTPFGNFCAGYEAAQQQSAGEIAKLKAIIELDKNIEAQEITALKADNERLRKALEKAYEKLKLHVSGTREYVGGTPTQFLFPLIEQALSATTSSLIEHDNEVIERCALALENAEGELKYLPEYVASLRKLKG